MPDDELLSIVVKYTIPFRVSVPGLGKTSINIAPSSTVILSVSFHSSPEEGRNFIQFLGLYTALSST